mmetsp:Transcript_38185/g.61824  ORF Transcript_38185/g.61824 Transcript_38185/m.61824 type:complete len:291 (+) Transcript_38185:68-940(+)|eukprot:CAMPEP_0184649326 /NCGR_PEP_ID=MMETSP0308-20130426/6668_1 /TAXON_ID=38269 /ORGANISM="Gloeochaete witrockiana, Strain SAG 46.84" /LENGTH=290 /DNA_ID=CAMNT_0027081961 /DNA_START=21 /DNA_END=893 /DNA_ORIENTATION=+
MISPRRAVDNSSELGVVKADVKHDGSAKTKTSHGPCLCFPFKFIVNSSCIRAAVQDEICKEREVMNRRLQLIEEEKRLALERIVALELETEKLENRLRSAQVPVSALPNDSRSTRSTPSSASKRDMRLQEDMRSLVTRNTELTDELKRMRTVRSKDTTSLLKELLLLKEEAEMPAEKGAVDKGGGGVPQSRPRPPVPRSKTRIVTGGLQVISSELLELEMETQNVAQHLERLAAEASALRTVNAHLVTVMDKCGVPVPDVDSLLEKALAEETNALAEKWKEQQLKGGNFD